MKNRRNYYRLLQVQPDAAPDVIKASYRTLMQKLRFHPDLGGDESNAVLVNEAYAVLSDPQRRARYDAAREAARLGLGIHGRVPSEGSGHGDPDTPRQHAPGAAVHGAGLGYAALVCVLCDTHNSVSVDTAGPRRCRACQSPLTRVDSGPGTGARERAVPRLERSAPVRYAHASPPGPGGSGLLEDLSSHGMRFSTDRALAAGTLLRIECELLGAVARVVACRTLLPPRHAIGVAFLTVDFQRSSGSLLAVHA